MNTVNNENMVCLPTDELLHQVAKSISLHAPFLSCAVSPHCTWKVAVRVAESSLSDRDREIYLPTQPRFGSRPILRQIAINNAQSPLSPLNAQSSFGLPIRTTIDTGKLGFPKRSSENVRQCLIKEAKNWPELPSPPALTIRATVTEKTMPLLSANVMLYGLDSTATDPFVSLANAELLWDTGAHSAVVVDELLPQKFKDYLAQPENDCYRSADGVRVQIDALITFSNQVLALSCVCVVVPRSAVPNSRVGILLGQHMCINKLVYKSVPQAILCARGESVPETIWGDILIEEYLDLDNIIHKF